MLALLSLPVAMAACVPKYDEGRYLINVSVNATTTRPLVLDVPSASRFASSPREGLINGGMIGFHGWHSNPWYYDKLSNLTNFTRHFQMVLALPFGTAPVPCEYCCPDGVSIDECSDGNYLATNLSKACGWNANSATGVDDIAYTRAIVKLLVEDLCVEEDKVFTTGLSNGGSMAARTACEAADVLAGVATMSGTVQVETCEPAKPIAYVAFCGNFDGSCNATIQNVHKLFAANDECKSTHRTYESATTRCHLSTGCARKSFVETCTIAGLGDDIPGHDRSAPIVPNTTLILQAASNVDSVKYSFDRLSALWPSDYWPASEDL